MPNRDMLEVIDLEIVALAMMSVVQPVGHLCYRQQQVSTMKELVAEIKAIGQGQPRAFTTH